MPGGGAISYIGNIVHIYDTGAQMEEFNRDLLGMIDNSYDAICIADGESRILLLNRAFEKVMGFSIRESIGRPIRELVASGLTDTSATLHVLETGKQSTVTINTSAGRQVLSTGVPVYGPDGGVQRVYCNIRDVTDLIRLRQNYGQSQRLASRYLMELQELRSSETSRHTLVTRSVSMQRVLDLAYRMAQVESNLLLQGESGTGKDLLAKIIHEASPRSDQGPLVKVNCAAIPGQLLESELFGHEAGAFTGAKTKGRPGYFEVADRGTLFLDEIGELPLSLQVKLLSVIQDRAVVRVGGTKPIPVDIRLVAATNRDLERMVTAGTFREDLYYRLSVVPIRLPPLRQRKDDVPFLLSYFLEHYSGRYRTQIRLAEDAMEALCRYKWPGNVRELINLVERLVVTAQDSLIRREHLPGRFQAPAGDGGLPPGALPRLKEAVLDLEIKLVQRAMEESGSREEAAAKLGVSLSSLTRRLRQARRVNSKGQK